MPVPLTGQIALSSTPQQLDPSRSAASCKAFTIKATVFNASAARVGASGVSLSTGHFLDPGDDITYERVSQNGQPTYEGQPSDFYVVGVSGDFVSWHAYL